MVTFAFAMLELIANLKKKNIVLKPVYNLFIYFQLVSLSSEIWLSHVFALLSYLEI